jgi:hypothetical protein
VTLALDSVGGVSQGSGATNWSWLHTPVAAPDAVLVVAQNGWLNSFTITSVTYGGVALALVARIQVGSSDAPSLYCYFKSGGLPTGPQTIAVTDSTNTAKLGTSWALLGSEGRGLEVQTVRHANLGTIANPSFVVECQDEREAFIAGCLSSGSNTIAASPLAGQTSERTADFGSYTAYHSRKTAIHGGGDTTYGYTVGAFQQMIVVAAISEVLAPGEAARYPGAIVF